jgi:hypothetical protein
MFVTAPRTWSVAIGFGAGQQLIDAPAHALQGLGFSGHIDVDHATNLVVIHFGGRVDHLNIGHGTERGVAAGVVAAIEILRQIRGLAALLIGAVACGPRAAQGNILEVLHRHVVQEAV